MFDSDVDVEGGGARAPGHNVENGVLVLSGRIVPRESRNVDFTAWIEVGVTESSEEISDHGGV